MTAEVDLLPLPSGNVAHLIAAQSAEIEALRTERDALEAENERLRNGLDRVIEFERDKAPFTCKYCGRPSWIDPSDQLPPPDYCHEIDHGTSEER